MIGKLQESVGTVLPPRPGGPRSLPGPVTSAGSPQTAPYITAKGRDLRIDLLRGYFVLAMIVDHVRGASPLWLLTGGNRFFVGAAEGFILVSGLVAGVVYSRLIGRDGMGRSFVKMLSRALKLYLLTVALTLAFLPLSELLDLPWAQGVDTRNPLALVVSIATLHRTYYLVDVMLLYTVLFLLAPLALVLIEQGKRWWVLGGSWLLWGLFQVWPEYAALPWPIAGNYLFNFSGWQVIFFTGLVLGYGRVALPVPGLRRARLWFVLSGVALLALIVLFFVVEPPTPVLPAPLRVTSSAGRDLRVLVENLFLDKVDVRPGRLLAGLVTFGFLFLGVTLFWRPLQRGLGWLLMPLGQDALYAYTVHVGLVALVAVLLGRVDLGSTGTLWLNALVQVGGVGLIWLLVRYRVLAPTPRTQRFYNLSPILFAVVAGIALFLVPRPDYPGLTDAAEAAAPVNRFGTPVPAAAAPAVNRFGTPVPAAAAPAVNRFGTPVPPRLDESQSDTAKPAPTPQPTPGEAKLALARVAAWVGKIDGTLEERWFYSRALGRDMPYWVYLPPDYDTAGQRYPVLYMLHGAGGHRDEWISYGLVSAADREIGQGLLPPMIIILPQGDQGFWVNNVDGPRWGDYVTQDLVAQADATFRTLREPGARAIGGLSMGGFGALTLAFTHPDVFDVVGAHTPSLHSESKDVAFLGSGEEYAQRDPVSLAGWAAGPDRLRIWIDIDEQDNWLGRAEQLHDILTARQVAHSWQVFPGSHSGDYWKAHIGDYLRFYGEALARG